MILGVIVGRFQVDQLHEGHKAIIERAMSECDRVLVVIGSGPLGSTTNNPLSYKHRMFNILWEYGDNMVIAELMDHPDDEIWSANLDSIISDHTIEDDVVLYHGRDSFASHYHGEHKLIEVPEIHLKSATDIRKDIGLYETHGIEARRGAIWATQNRFPIVYSCVDGAVVHTTHPMPGEKSHYVLLITKPGVKGYMFPGGFAEIGSTDEKDIEREVLEETGIVAKTHHYIGSFVQDDWRYRGEVDEIRTRLFVLSVVQMKKPTGSDDAETAEWVPWSDIDENSFNPCHRALYGALSDYIDDYLGYG